MLNKQLLFIGGFPSGGTDLLKNILNAHHDVFINGEMPFLYKLPIELNFSVANVYSKSEAEQIIDWLTDQDIWNNLKNKNTVRKKVANTGKHAIDQKKFFYELFLEKERMVWGNKTPQNTEYAQSLFKLFPDSKLVVVTRDVRDVVLSWKKKWGKNPHLVADKWNRRMCQIYDLTKEDDRIILIKFEDLLSETVDITKKICDFIGIEWDKKMLKYHEHTENVIDGKINYGEPLKKDNKQKWKTQASPKIIRQVEEIAFEGMKKLDYKIAYAEQRRKLGTFYKKYAMVYDALAMLFVGNRAKENNSVADRISQVAKQIKLRIS